MVAQRHQQQLYYAVFQRRPFRILQVLLVFPLISCLASALDQADRPYAGATPSWDARGGRGLKAALPAFTPGRRGLRSSEGQLSILQSAVVRLSGPAILPFTPQKQQALVEVGNKIMVAKVGPSEMVTFEEGYTHSNPQDPLSPKLPYVDLAVNVYEPVPSMEVLQANDTNTALINAQFQVMLEFVLAFVQTDPTTTLRVLSIDNSRMYRTRPVVLQPIEVMVAVLRAWVDGEEGEGADWGGVPSPTETAGYQWMTTQQLSAVRLALSTCMETGAVLYVGISSTNATVLEEMYASDPEGLDPTVLGLPPALPPPPPPPAAPRKSWLELSISLPACAPELRLEPRAGQRAGGEGGRRRRRMLGHGSQEGAPRRLQQQGAPVEEQAAACGEGLVATLLDSCLADDSVQRLLGAAGVSSLELWALGPRRTPTATPTPRTPASDGPVTTPTPDGAIRGPDTPLPAADPASPANLTAPFVPWHLQWLTRGGGGQGAASVADADGSGVNVYLLASGIRATHDEFRHPDGRPGSRVRAGWGYMGYDPLSDCEDAFAWYGFGTFAASIIGGRTLGVAKNVTLHSVRFRERCLFDGPEVWEAGGLPAAMDLVISAHAKPAIMVVDTWWSPARLSNDKDEYVRRTILERLDRAYAADITVVVAAGSGLEGQDPCDNVLAEHHASISVGGVDSRNMVSYNTPTNSSCITLFGPAGGLGNTMVGASAMGDSDYTDVYPRAWGASWVAAGVAAQYLQRNPSATPDQVREALVQLAREGEVVGAGVAPNRLLFSNLTQPRTMEGADGAAAPPPQPPPPPASPAEERQQGGQLTGGTIGAIVAGVAAGTLMVTLVGVVIFRRWRLQRQRPDEALEGEGVDVKGLALEKGGQGSAEVLLELPLVDSAGWKEGGGAPHGCGAPCQVHPQLPRGSQDSSPPPSAALPLDPSEWEITPDQLQVVKRPDGSDWELGCGYYGRVVKAVRDDVQVVAVKTLTSLDTTLREQFLKEVAIMKFVSRDPNIVQFYGACLSCRYPMLVEEFMEGGDLRQALTEDSTGFLRWYSRGKALALDILRGLHFLHTNNVTHRDIKSKNILLTGDGRAKIADVGLAEVLLGERYFADGLMGTFAWAGPEMLLGERCTDKVDMYSFGVVLWEILTQEVPIRGALRPIAVPQDCPQEVADVVAACLQRDPAVRPTAKEAYAALLAAPPVGPMRMYSGPGGHSGGGGNHPSGGSGSVWHHPGGGGGGEEGGRSGGSSGDTPWTAHPSPAYPASLSTTPLHTVRPSFWADAGRGAGSGRPSGGSTPLRATASPAHPDQLAAAAAVLRASAAGGVDAVLPLGASDGGGTVHGEGCPGTFPLHGRTQEGAGGGGVRCSSSSSAGGGSSSTAGSVEEEGGAPPPPLGQLQLELEMFSRQQQQLQRPPPTLDQLHDNPFARQARARGGA